MVLVSSIFSGLAGVEHIYIMTIEMFFFGTPYVNKVFGIKDKETAKHPLVKTLAANQGLYNGLLSAGLLWAAATGRQDLTFAFNGAVVVAALYGAITVKPTILFIQGGPSIAALIVAGLGH
ncbi:hypothetical protein HK100_001668 [Physocladia obscura]|uniref:DUF1304 domain-containing protein n=1 Tax=Physocladia obscura TaxID=109957 RepID=A0AAD5XFZ9_9FUNG|nr:hypothetical protein HK100_001668 [Physocladia obscura]